LKLNTHKKNKHIKKNADDDSDNKSPHISRHYHTKNIQKWRGGVEKKAGEN